MIMPMYTFKCPVCRDKQEVVRPMAKSEYPVSCVVCGEDMERDFQADIPHVASDTYDNPIISDSMAMAIEQIPEHKKMFPNIEVTPEGQPIFDNYAEHQAYLDKCGFVKHPGTPVNNSGKTVYKLSDMKARLESSK